MTGRKFWITGATSPKAKAPDKPGRVVRTWIGNSAAVVSTFITSRPVAAPVVAPPEPERLPDAE